MSIGCCLDNGAGGHPDHYNPRTYLVAHVLRFTPTITNRRPQIKQHSSSTTCNLPEHGHSSCHRDDLCRYDCEHGYQPYTTPGSDKPSSCYCPAPKTECNGQCGDFPNGCGSATPKRRNTRRAAPPSCPRGATICGIAGNPTGWECIDTETDKESCTSFYIHLWLKLTRTCSGQVVLAWFLLPSVFTLSKSAPTARISPMLKLSTAYPASVPSNLASLASMSPPRRMLAHLLMFVNFTLLP